MNVCPRSIMPKIEYWLPHCWTSACASNWKNTSTYMMLKWFNAGNIFSWTWKVKWYSHILKFYVDYWHFNFPTIFLRGIVESRNLPWVFSPFCGSMITLLALLVIPIYKERKETITITIIWNKRKNKVEDTSLFELVTERLFTMTTKRSAK